MVLIEVCKLTLKALREKKFIIRNAKKDTKKVAHHSAECYEYDVSSEYVSIHIPLTRFFAGLFMHLSKFSLSFKDIADFGECLEEIIEPVLCTRVFISQSLAGMWRRNGESVKNQTLIYNNLNYRWEMLDRDIQLLQVGAALMESNVFLIHLLNKFELYRWIRGESEVVNTLDNYSLSNFLFNSSVLNEKAVLVDDLLELLIVIVGERYKPGISTCSSIDQMKKEIIQQLCAKPMSHSELSNAINGTNADEHKHDIDSLIREVAQVDVSSDKKTVYRLKDEFFSDYNLFFYHYTKEERYTSEETQRLRHKNKKEPNCYPPPLLPVLLDHFKTINNLLQCDVMLAIMRKIFSQTNAEQFTDSHLHRVLHLIGYAIQEEESDNYPELKFVDRAIDLLPLMEQLLNNPKVS